MIRQEKRVAAGFLDITLEKAVALFQGHIGEGHKDEKRAEKPHGERHPAPRRTPPSPLLRGRGTGGQKGRPRLHDDGSLAEAVAGLWHA